MKSDQNNVFKMVIFTMVNGKANKDVDMVSILCVLVSNIMVSVNIICDMVMGNYTI